MMRLMMNPRQFDLSPPYRRSFRPCRGGTRFDIGRGQSAILDQGRMVGKFARGQCRHLHLVHIGRVAIVLDE